MREVHKGPVGEKAVARAREGTRDPDAMDIGKVACTYCKKPGHAAAICYRKKAVDERQVKGLCFKCGKPGHVSKTCTSKRVAQVNETEDYIMSIPPL